MRRFAALLLALVWYFPVIASFNSLLSANPPWLTAPATGLQNSNKILLFALTLLAFGLSSPKFPRPSLSLGLGSLFLVWGPLSSVLGLRPFESLIFCSTWFAAFFTYSATKQLLKRETLDKLAPFLIYLPALVVATAGIAELVFGQKSTVTGPFGLSNVYSNWMMFLLPSLLLGVFQEKKGRFVLALGASSIVLASLALTFSRTSWVLTLAQIGFFLLLVFPPTKRRALLWGGFSGIGFLLAMGFRGKLGGNAFLILVALLFFLPGLVEMLRAQNKEGKVLPLLALGSVTLLVLGLSVASPHIDFSEHAGSRLERFASGDNSGRSRLDFWKAASLNAITHPLLGTGPDTFPLAYPQFQSHYYYYSDSPHCTFLELASDLGAAGAIIFVALLGAFLTRVQKTGTLDKRGRVLLLGLLFGLAHAQTDVTYQFTCLWISLAAVAACLSPEHKTKESPSLNSLLMVLTAVLFSVSIYLFFNFRNLEQSKALQDPEQVVQQTSALAARFPFWSEPNLRALSAGFELVRSTDDPNSKKIALSRLEPLVQRAENWSPQNAIAQRYVGRWYRLNKTFPQAKTHLLKAVELDPYNYPAVYLELLLLAIESEDAEDEAKWSKLARDRYPLRELEKAHTAQRNNLESELVPLFYVVAERLNPFQRGQVTEPLFRFILKQTKAANAHYGLAASLYSQGRFRAARHHFAEAHRLNPYYPPPAEAVDEG